MLDLVQKTNGTLISFFNFFKMKRTKENSMINWMKKNDRQISVIVIQKAKYVIQQKLQQETKKQFRVNL